MIERREAEIRLAGRTLTGDVMVYGSQARDRPERFESGAFNPLPDALALNLQHDPQREIASLGNGLVLQDTSASLELRAELRPDSAELRLVQRGALNGLSVEFHARHETRESGIRVIERAELAGIGLVDMPSYDRSRIELRQRRLTTLRGVINEGVEYGCECAPDDCLSAVFEQNSLASLLPANAARDLLGVAGDYKGALASRKMRTLRFWRDADGNLQYALDLPDTQAARDILGMMESVPVYGRPIIDTAASTFTKQGTTALYTDVAARGILIGPTDADRGWTPLRERLDDNDDLPEGRAAEPKPGRTHPWL